VDEDGAKAASPVGDNAPQASAIPISEGFNLTLVEFLPGSWNRQPA
jgi:hypothetical protein